MKKILGLMIIGGFLLASCGHSTCAAYSHNYDKNQNNIESSILEIHNDASAEAQG